MDSTTIIRIVAGILFLGICIPLYFLPAIIARNKRNSGAIFVVNLLFGWSVIGWIAALIWALTNDPVPIILTHPQIPVQPGPALLCAGCGKYAHLGTRFCPSCGQPL